MKKIKVKRAPSGFEVGVIVGLLALGAGWLSTKINKRIYGKPFALVTGYSMGANAMYWATRYGEELYEEALDIFNKFFEVVDEETE